MKANAIFDIDGTVFNTEHGILHCLRGTFAAIGCDCPPDEKLRECIGPSLHYGFTQVAGLSEESAARAITEYRALYLQEGLYDCEFYDGIPELLQTLFDRGVRLCVASSKPLPSVEKLLRHFDIYRLFERVAAPGFAVKSNEKADLIRSARVCDDAIMVGDRRFDIEGAAANGIPSIGVTYGFAPKGEFDAVRPTFVAHNAADIQAVILG